VVSVRTTSVAQEESVATTEPVASPPGFWERPELLRIEGGPREWLEEHGVAVDLWFTQFYQGVVAGDGDHSWQ
jgi:hypothetical protein